MIPKGNLHGAGGRLATYLTKGEDNERAELIDMRGIAADDLRKGFCDIMAIAESQTQCEKPFFHAYVRLPADESLTREQWLVTADRIEAKLGFDGQPRGVALHFLEDGTAHMHVAWSRIDMDQMKAIDPGLYLNKMKEVCRELEVEFGLQELSSDRADDRRTRAPHRPEFEQARRLGVDVEEVRETIRDCFDRSDSGPAFVAALDDVGLGFARGDRRSFVVIDQEGGLHALSKRITGITMDATRERLGAGFEATLPDIETVRAQQAARREAEFQTGSEVHSATGDAHSIPARNQDKREAIKAEITPLWQASDSGPAFVGSIKERGYALCRGERRDFLLMDAEGDVYALPRVIEGVRTVDVRAKLSDVDRDSLPSIAEARVTMEARAAAPETVRPVAQAGDYHAETPAASHDEPVVETRAVDDAARGIGRGGGKILGAIGDAAGKAIEGLSTGLEGLLSFDVVPVPEHARGEVPPPPVAKPESPVSTKPNDGITDAQRVEIERMAQKFRDAQLEDYEAGAEYQGPDAPLERRRPR